jgi:DNA polymerase type B, organellar and viral
MPRKAMTLRPFMGVDGEGCGRNRKGQQHYKLLRAGDAGQLLQLHTGRHLRTAECLDFICKLPADRCLVGFSFGYDATQILRDLSPERIERLFDMNKPWGEGFSRWVYWNDFALQYIPKNFLRVARVRRGYLRHPNGEPVRHPITGALSPTMQIVPKSTRTVWETFGFFQSTFLKALQDFDVGREHWPEIERNKAGRSAFVRITERIKRYCGLECQLLADLMERFRTICLDTDIRPASWSGAGKLASYLHAKHRTITRPELESRTPAGVLQAANDAYYGGRFEVTHVGLIDGPIHECDIGSAYPDAMRQLPCLLHGDWQEASPAELSGAGPGALFVAAVHFRHPPGVPLCGLPVRTDKGVLVWPGEGNGVYWSPELRSAERLGATLDYRGGWRYVQRCQCHAFDWIDPLYRVRLSLGKGARGKPLKLGLNSLYGKLAQRIGNPRYGNLIWAGLITALTRAKLNQAIAQAPGQILMLATDAVLSRVPLQLPIGDQLGQWEAETHDRLFIVQPGLYWGAKRPKTRGVPVSLFHEHTGRFERAWGRWCERSYMLDSAGWRQRAGKPVRDVPAVTVPLTLFTGIRLAHARGKPATAGSWVPADKEFSFDWGRKRSTYPIAWASPRCVATLPWPGDAELFSLPHKGNAVRIAELDLNRAELDEQPDHVDLSMPGREG